METEDLLFLFGYKRNKRCYKEDSVKIEAENAWLEGHDANKNPYPPSSDYHRIWYQTWRDCNLYA